MEPITREEVFMKAAANGEATPEPITRTELFLKKIADNVKGGGVTSWNDLKDKPFGENKDGTIKPLDEKYLPDSVKGGGGGKTLIINATGENLTTNMTLTEAIEAINKHELTNVLMFAPYDDSQGLPAYLRMSLWCDASSEFGNDCIFIMDASGERLFWTSAGLSSTPPGV